MKRRALALPLAGSSARGAALASALGLAAAGLATAAPAPASAAPQAGQATSADDLLRARELFRKGREEYAKEHLPQACAFFLDAWALQKSFDIAGNLASVERQLNRYRDATEHVSFALAHFPAGGTPAQYKALEDLLKDVRPFVGAITIRVSVARAAVTVDGKPVGESPLPSELFADPGVHTVAATAPGCDPAQDTVQVDKAGTHMAILTLRCGGTTTTQIQPVTLPAEGPRPLTIAGFAATGLGVGLGTAFAILSKTKADSANQIEGPLQTSGGARACAGTLSSTSATQCANLGSARSGEATFAGAALGTFLAAGAVGAATLVYTFAVPRAPANPAAKAARVQVIPLAGPGAGAVVLKGGF